jgi:hypothetical protein
MSQYVTGRVSLLATLQMSSASKTVNGASDIPYELPWYVYNHEFSLIHKLAIIGLKNTGQMF